MDREKLRELAGQLLFVMLLAVVLLPGLVGYAWAVAYLFRFVERHLPGEAWGLVLAYLVLQLSAGWVRGVLRRAGFGA